MPGYEGRYDVSDYGGVRRSLTAARAPGEPLAMASSEWGYLAVTLWRDGARAKKGVHVLVAEAFLGPCPEPDWEVDHVDGNKLDNRAIRLEWVSHPENIRRAWARRTDLARMQIGSARRARLVASRLESPAPAPRSTP